MRGCRAFTAAAILLTACVPVDDLGTLVVVDNGTDRALYFATSSIGWDALTVPAGAYGQAEFVDSGTNVYLFAEQCELIGSAIIGDEDVSLQVMPNRSVTMARPSARDQMPLEDYVAWAPGCGPGPSVSQGASQGEAGNTPRKISGSELSRASSR